MNILFVDDEPCVLEALRYALFRERARWCMVFALGAEAALLELASKRFDAVVCDLRMPHMDGATLLTHVRATQPAAARIVLSGNAETALMARVNAVADEFLSKPCRTSDLRRCLQRLEQSHAP